MESPHLLTGTVRFFGAIGLNLQGRLDDVDRVASRQDSLSYQPVDKALDQHQGGPPWASGACAGTGRSSGSLSLVVIIAPVFSGES
jgi:hypothetical protein